MPADQSDVFISYKAEDRPRLSALVAALRAEGFSVWWDQDIGGGSDWREDIERHLDAARCVLVVWSKRSIGPAGRFVRDEAGQGQETGRYLPITIDPVRPPLGFREHQAIPFQRWKGDRDDPRFVALADAVRRRLEGEELAPLPHFKGGTALSRRNVLAGGAGIAAVAAAGGFFLLRPRPIPRSRIAVLPFANLSGDTTQDYFSDGLAEELRSALSRAGLQVIGRNSSEAVAEEDTRTIVKKLKVSHILTGSVRRSPDTIRVSAQLVNGKDGVESWAQNYDSTPGDAIEIQVDIAEKVAGALSVAMGVIHQAVISGGTKDPAAQDLYLRAEGLTEVSGATREALEEAIGLYGQAIARDPLFASAWSRRGAVRSGLSGLFSSSPKEFAAGMAAVERDVRRALAIEPRLTGASALLAAVEESRFNFRGALKIIERAVREAPNDAPTLRATTSALTFYGPLALAERAVAAFAVLEPLSPGSYLRQSTLAQIRGRLDESIAYGERGLAAFPENTSLASILATSQVLAGKLDLAEKTATRIPKDDMRRLILDAQLSARRGDKAGAERFRRALEAQYGEFGNFQYAQIYAQTDRIDLAFKALEEAIRVKDPGLMTVMRDPLLRPLHLDRRFGALLKWLDFPIIDRGTGVG